jgi:hypothetical protein
MKLRMATHSDDTVRDKESMRRVKSHEKFMTNPLDLSRSQTIIERIKDDKTEVQTENYNNLTVAHLEKLYTEKIAYYRTQNTEL